MRPVPCILRRYEQAAEVRVETKVVCGEQLGAKLCQLSKAAYSQVPAMLCHVCTRALTLEHE